MKKVVLLFTAVFVCAAQAEVQQLQGSDTLAGVMKEVIETAKLTHLLNYIGGGSGKGEEALIKQKQGIAAMSREVTPEAISTAQDKGISLIPHSIAVDGVAMLVNQKNTLKKADLASLKDIFSCKITRWEDVPGSDQWGDIVVYRRDDASGTTDAVKHVLGLKALGACTKVVLSAEEITQKTANESNAIGYSGLSGVMAGKNRPLAIAKSKNDKAIEPTRATIQNRTYPLSRNLYVYSVGGKGVQSNAEQELMHTITDRKTMDTIVEKHDFYAIP